LYRYNLFSTRATISLGAAKVSLPRQPLPSLTRNSFGCHLSKSDPKDRLYWRCDADLFRDDRCCLTFFSSCFVAWAACFAAFLSTSVIFITYPIRFYLSPSIISAACRQISSLGVLNLPLTRNSFGSHLSKCAPASFMMLLTRSQDKTNSFPTGDNLLPVLTPMLSVVR